MSKKYILSAVFCGALLVANPATAMLQNDLQTEYTEVSTEGEQTNVEGDWTNSEEVNTVQESPLARKMTQAEKAQNAAENDSFGGAITIIAMCIVLGALIILSILFLCFGKIFTSVISHKKRAAHGVTAETSEDHHDELDSGEVIAAIGMALAEHFGQGHDMEDTILTIKRMKKSYSPWNSKIYNMRQTPKVTAASTHRRPLK